MAKQFRFEPERIAYFEATGWRAYYDREWLKLLRLIVGLCQEQFSIPFPVSLLAAYNVVRASVAWVPLDHDEQKVLKYYERFYRIARRYSGLKFDPATVAKLELQYNDVHRRLSGKPDKTDFIETMAALHSAIFSLTAEQVRQSAELRVLANNAVDLITSRTSTDVAGDWAKLEEYLRRCYESINRELEQAGRLGKKGAAKMAINDYHFITHWQLENTTVEEVASILGDAKDLERWWPSVYLEVQVLESGDEKGIGKLVDLYTKGWLPYTLRWQFRVTESNYPHGFTLQALGDFVGRGIWKLVQDGTTVKVEYDWKIQAAKPLLRRLSFMLKPIFAMNHNWAMEMGEKSLKLELLRRHATTEAARQQISAPPPPTSSSSVPMMLGMTSAVAGVGASFLIARNLTKKKEK